jgi:adenylosuccinate synthase
MKLDVFSALSEIQLCVAYELDGKRVRHFPSHVDDLRRVTPVYETLPGWQQDISGVRRMTDLPANALKYLKRLSEVVERPVALVSVGADREQTILAG